MKDLILKLSIFTMIFLFISCEKDKNIVVFPEDTTSLVTAEDLKKITIDQVAYDSVVIKNSEELVLETQDVIRIFLIEENNGIDLYKDSIDAQYSENDIGYLLEFTFGRKVDSSHLLYPFTIRFLLIDSTSIDIDTLNLMYKYPYESTEIFMTYDEIFADSGPDRVQDFDFNTTDLFVHPTAAFGLYQYNFSSKEFRGLENYSSGDFIAHDSIYVFYEISSYAIYRYDLEKDTTDSQLNLNGLDYTHIGGMDIYKNKLYAYMHSQDSGNKMLVKFDLNGNIIETIPFPRTIYHMAIDDDIVYNIYYNNGKIKLSRFSLISKSFLDDKLFPTEYWDGIRIFEDKFYFADFKKRFIGMVPLSEFEN